MFPRQNGIFILNRPLVGMVRGQGENMIAVTFDSNGLTARLHEAGKPLRSVRIHPIDGWDEPENCVVITSNTGNTADGLICTRREDGKETGFCVVHPRRFRPSAGPADEGAPAFDRDHAAALAAVGVPAFACTPDAFADLLAAAIERRDLARFAEGAGLATAAPVASRMEAR